MEVITEKIKYLTNYQHVADFQRFCGIKILPIDSVESSCYGIVQNGAAATGSPANGSNGAHHRNGKTIQNGVKNGTNGINHHPPNEDQNSMEIKSEVKQNGQVQNGVTVQNEYSYHPGGQNMVYKVENKALYYLFEFGASLGNELFYLTFYPFLFWNVSSKMCRQIVFVWHILMYCGQIMKDYIRWPRPMAPAVRLERRFDMEFGMPSTHAIVGSCVPFTLLYLTANTYEIPLSLGLLLAVSWTALVSFSRVYLGMHTAADVIAGQWITGITLPFLLPRMNMIDHWVVTSPYAPIFIGVLPFLSCVYYPKQKEWSITRGDTANIMSIGSGVVLGSWLSYQLGLITYPAPSPVLLPLALPSSTWLWQSAVRLVMGVGSLSIVRSVSKKIFLRILLAYYAVKKEDIQTQRTLGMEVPLRYFNIFTIAIMTSFLLPIVYRYFNICGEGL